ncbi:MAG: branched-chain amino acid ABC transporter permease [Dehalococcoidales bacterium]|nr:branched-chain amino acid ABC transporter permease [Dehalococcoidales bacterium]
MSDTIVISQVLLQGLMVGAMYGLIAFGMTMIFSTTGLLNFAHGGFLAVGMYLCVTLYAAFRMSPYISILITVPVLFGMGYFLYRYIVWKVLKIHIITAAQITLGLLWIIESSLSMIFGADIRSVPTTIGIQKVYLGPLTLSVPYIISFIVAIIVGIMLYWLMQRTDFGRSVRAVTQNRDAAELMGIRVVRIQTIVFGLGLALLGVCSPLIIAMVPTTPSVGLQFTLFAFIIMMLGGIGNFLGTVIAGLIFGVVDAYGRFFFTGYIASVIPYSLLVLVLLVRPRGLLGEK